jgi:integrase
MVWVMLKGVHTVKSKGRVYYYAWRGGPPLEGEPGTQVFLDSYTAAKSPASHLDRKRFEAWIALYRDSDDFKDLAPSTKEIWSKWLDRIRDEFGKLSVKQFDRPKFRVDIRKWRNKWKSTPRTADYAKQVLSRVLTFIVAEGELAWNICNDIENLYTVDRSEIIWEEHHWSMLMNCDKVSDEIKWAARLFRRTGFRLSDGIKVSWVHASEFALEIKTQKSSGKLSKRKRTATAPMVHDLRALLDEIPKRATTILTNSRGRPWTADGFGSSWWKAMKDAGLHAQGIDLHLHDLRGTYATDLFRAGFAVREIAVTLGWTEERVERLLDRYVKRDEILRDRIRRIEALDSLKRQNAG